MFLIFVYFRTFSLLYANDKKNSIFPSFEKVTIQILGQRKTVFITDLSAGKKLYPKYVYQLKKYGLNCMYI